MTPTIFVALRILSCDFLIHAFLHWTFGEKRRLRPRKRLAHARSASDSRTSIWNERLAYRTIVAAFPPPRR